MTKITWRGEDDGPPSCTWNGITFPVGLAVEVTDETMIRKARGNRFFRVEEDALPQSPPVEEDALPQFPQPVIEPTGAKAPATQWREPATEADPKDVSFFDDPPDDEPKSTPRRPRKVTADGQ